MFLYRTLMPVLIGLSKIIVGVRTDKSALKGVKGPYLIVGNHTSPIDFLYFTAGVYPKPINFVVAENMIYRKVYGAFIRSFGTIKKKQFTAMSAADIFLISSFVRTGASFSVTFVRRGFPHFGPPVYPP